MTPIEMQNTTEEIIRVLGTDIDIALREYFPGSKFALIIFPANNPKVCNYVANAKSEEVLEVIKTLNNKLTSKEADVVVSRAIH